MTASAALFSATPLSVRHLSDSVSIHQIIFFRNLFALVLMAPWLMRMRLADYRTDRFGLHLARAIFTFFGLFTLYYAIARIPMAEVIALNFTTPLFVIVLAALILRETVGPRRWAATLIGFIGALIIIRPGMVEISFAALVALGAAAIYAISNIIVKTLTKTESTPLILFYFYILVLPMAGVPMLFNWQTPDIASWLWLAFLALSNSLANLCLTRSFRAADLSLIYPFDFMRLPVTAFLGFVFFAEMPDAWTWIGAGVIFASSYYIARREARIGRLARNAKDAP